MDYKLADHRLRNQVHLLIPTFFVGRDGQACRLVRFDPETREAMALATLPVLIQPGSAHLAATAATFTSNKPTMQSSAWYWYADCSGAPQWCT